jgi:RNA polymerase sigma-70 factor, ECF subfamily
LELKASLANTQAIDPVLRPPIDNNREALDELFARYRGRLYHTARRVLGNSDDAEDALQDGLLSAFRNLSGFKGRSQFSTWLTRIVVNAALMRLRRIRPEEMTSSIDQKVDPEDQPLANRIPDPGPNPEERFARQERFQILVKKLQNLPTAYRQAVRLCDVQGMSLREAAEALGLPIGTLKSQLHRARLRLGEEVAETRRAQRVFQPSRGDAAIARYRPTMEVDREINTAGGLRGLSRRTMVSPSYLSRAPCVIPLRYSIPSRRILLIRVVRGIPRRDAAPCCPPMTPFTSSRV